MHGDLSKSAKDETLELALGQDFSKFDSKTDLLQQFTFLEISIENRAPDTKSCTGKRLRGPRPASLAQGYG